MDILCGIFLPLHGDDETRNLTSADEQFHSHHNLLRKNLKDDDYADPFSVYRDGYHWPDLYSEITEMLEPCILVMAIAELRLKARQGEVALSGKPCLKTPFTHRDVMKVVEANRKQLEDSSFGKDYVLDVLQAATERNMMKFRDTNGKERAARSSELNISNNTIIAFDDKYANEELVYMMEVNTTRKRITVCFRSSTTKTDWATNLQLYMKEIENPLYGHGAQPPTLRVHHGFYDYLFKPSERGAKGPNGEALSEYQEIFQEHLFPILKKYPGYKLYVTGHSLGGALGTLFAFEAAALPDNVIPKPVSLFSFGAPYVGDDSFREAFRLLESQGKLRYCRVTNQKDMVPLVPKVSFKWTFYDPEAFVGATFKHVGMNLRFFGDMTPFEILYPKVRTGWLSSAYDEMSRGWEQTLFSNWMWNPVSWVQWPHHGLREYNRRIGESKAILENMYLNELYARPDIVGKLVAQF